MIGSIWSAGTNSSTSMAREVVSGRSAKSSSVRMTISPPPMSYPLAMSSKVTSSPSMEQVRLYLMRPPSVRWTWWNRMSFSSVAEYSLTAIDTSPNETAPFQIARIVASYSR
jgi:hypothetical protein